MNIPVELYTELLNHVLQTIEDQELEDFEELHFHAFNEDHYIIGYYQASEWLKKHDIDAFEAIAEVIEWEENQFEVVNLKAAHCNAETIANLYVYIAGEELLSEFDLDASKEELIAELKQSLKEVK